MHIQINTISDQLILFMHQYALDEKYIAERIKLSPQALSRRIKMNSWRFWEIESLKRLFSEYKYKGQRLELKV